ncbi:MAG: hypothetical protein ABJA79_00880 [Parafilimonas sp.]
MRFKNKVCIVTGAGSEDAWHVNELSLYDLDRKIMPVIKAYKKIIEQWQHVLVSESYGLHFR